MKVKVKVNKAVVKVLKVLNGLIKAAISAVLNLTLEKKILTNKVSFKAAFKVISS